MNYILQIKAFYDRLEINPLNSSEIALWNALMHINNKTAWSNTFTVASSVLCQKSGMKDTSKSSTFFNARNGLTQKGYINWESRRGQQAAIYHINNLYEDLSTIIVDNPVGKSVDNSVVNVVDNPVALNKLNKTKQKEEENVRVQVFNFWEQEGFGSITGYLSEQISAVIEDYQELGVDENIGYQMILLALKTAVEADAKRWNYVSKVLDDWQAKRLLTIDAVKAEQTKWQEKHHSQLAKPQLHERPEQQVSADKAKARQLSQWLEDQGERDGY